MVQETQEVIGWVIGVNAVGPKKLSFTIQRQQRIKTLRGGPKGTFIVPKGKVKKGPRGIVYGARVKVTYKPPKTRGRKLSRIMAESVEYL